MKITLSIFVQVAMILIMCLCQTKGDGPDDAKVVAALEDQMSRAGSAEAADVSELLVAEPNTVLRALHNIANRSTVETQHHAFEAIHRIGLDSERLDVRQSAVEFLISGMLNATASENFHQCRTALMEFRAQDFSPRAIGTLLRHADNTGAIWVLGVAGARQAIPKLRQIAERKVEDRFAEGDPVLKDRFYRESAEWAARCALARLGDRESIRFCIDRIEGVEDETKRMFVYFPYFNYIRQPEVVKKLTEYLFRDGETPTDGDLLGSPYALHAILHLSQMIEGFPVTFDDVQTRPREEVIQEAREWVTAQKELKIIR